MLRTSFEVTMPKALWALAVVLCLASPTLAQDLNTKLTDAARTRDTAEVRKLLAQGADPNTKDKNGRTPLMEAAAGGYTDTVRVLLENGADVNTTDLVGWNALFWAALSRRTDTLRALVAKGSDVNAKDNEKRTALFWAAYFGYTDTVRALLAKGARANARDSHGWTALMSAADLGHIDAADLAVLEDDEDHFRRGAARPVLRRRSGRRGRSDRMRKSPVWFPRIDRGGTVLCGVPDNSANGIRRCRRE